MDRINILASIFEKAAQQIDPVKLNHAIRIEQQAQILTKMVNEGIKAGTIRHESRPYSEGLQRAAIEYRLGIQQNKAKEELQTLHDQMMEAFNNLAQRYVDESYEPMKKIKESLLYLWFADQESETEQ